MTRTLILLGLLAPLAACGDGEPLFTDPDPIVEPVDPVDPDDPDAPPTAPTGTEVPEEIAGNVASAAYVPGSDTILVSVTALDSTPVVATYRRDPTYDQDNPATEGVDYVAYTVQEDELDRFFTALAARSPDGAVQAAVVADGGQFNTHYGGAVFERIGSYSPHDPSQPDNGLVSYAGTYAGLTNISYPVSAPPVDPSLIPERSAQVTGDVFMNADFSDNVVVGSVYNRELEGVGAIPTVILVDGEINAEGAFGGEIQPFGENEGIGSYAGLFGGSGASSAAGAVQMADHLGDESIEHGVFVLTRCGAAGDSSICDLTDP